MSDKSAADYYIIDMRGPLGDCAVFWRHEGKGYTTRLDEAGLFTLEDASSHRETDIPVHKDLVAKASVAVASIDRLRQFVELNPRRRRKP